MKRTDKTPVVTKADLIKGFKELGLIQGDVVLVHSAMRTFGYIEGGADTVVNAFLKVLGDKGTLVVPTFCYFHEIEEDPIIDPINDPSEMGIITETVRLRKDSVRSTAFRHSLAAIGRRARVITEVDPALSSFDPRSSFGVLLALNVKIMFLGVTYSSSTTHHLAEYSFEVPYRHTIELEVKVRLADVTLVPQKMTDYQPFTYIGSRSSDYNKLGRMLEEREKVNMTAIGNAIVRCFNLRDMIDLALEEAKKDFNIFRTAEGKAVTYTDLDFGTIVLSPPFEDSARRPGRIQWCVKDPSKLIMPKTIK